MPSLLMHLTLARRTAKEAPASPLSRAGRAAPDALLLGSILPDLPYHERFFQQTARHLTKLPYRLTEWGDIFHYRTTGQLALSLLCHVSRARLPEAEHTRALALAAGYLSHYSADRTVHPAINREVDRRRASSESDAKRSSDTVHAEVERLQALLYHHDETGGEICGTSYPRRSVREVAGTGLLRPGVNGELRDALRAALLETHGRAPTAAQWRDWLWGITVYAELMSSPLGYLTERLKGDVAELRRRHYQGPDLDLQGPLEAAITATFDAWDAASELLAAERIGAAERATFLRRIPDVDLGNGH